MNIQTERLENHTARFTVELELDRLEQAKQTAARNLAKRVNIPGFRKGKVPYKILLNYVGEAAVLEDAVEILGNEIYKEALDGSGVEPYGPGELEHFDIQPKPTFKFVVPLQPTVNLNDYRSIRMEFTVPEVEDDMVNRSMRLLQEQNAVVEESRQPVALGNRVTVDIHAVKVEEDESSETEAADHDHDHDEHDHDHDHDHNHDDDMILHQHDAVIVLSDEHDEPAPGFREALVGAVLDEVREFLLTYPDDEDEYEDLAGQKAKFSVTLKKIETMTLPVLNDEFAARVTEKEEKQLTLLELRMRMRESLQKNLEQRAKSDFAGEALDKIVEQAAISYPEALVKDQVESILQRLDQDLRRQGLTLNDYTRITAKSLEDLRNDYHESGVNMVRRSLVLREVMLAENVAVNESRIDEQIDSMAAQFGEQAAQFRPMFDTPAMRENVRNDLLEQTVLDRIVDIVTGKAPELSAESVSEPSSDQGEKAET